MKTMTVTMLDTVEDSNEFQPSEVDVTKVPDTAIHQHQVMKTKRVKGKPVPYVAALRRVDKLYQGQEFTLPKSQAQKLIDLEFAERTTSKSKK